MANHLHVSYVTYVINNNINDELSLYYVTEIPH